MTSIFRRFSLAAFGLMVMSSTLAAEEKVPGIISIGGAEAILSTREMKEGGEMWALILSLGPRGKVVSAGTNKGAWAGLEFVMAGTAVSRTAYPKGTCRFVGHEGALDPSGIDITAVEGDWSACVLSAESPWWEENRGAAIFTKAGLYVGGPSAETDTHIGPEYEKSGTTTYWMGLDAGQFKQIEKELRDAGSMKLSVRRVVMSPGSRLVAPDRYPVFRFIEAGKLRWGAIPPSSPDTDNPKVLFNALSNGWIGWMRPGRAVLLNAGNIPAEFIEFSVVPAPGFTP